MQSAAWTTGFDHSKGRHVSTPHTPDGLHRTAQVQLRQWVGCCGPAAQLTALLPLLPGPMLACRRALSQQWTASRLSRSPGRATW